MNKKRKSSSFYSQEILEKKIETERKLKDQTLGLSLPLLEQIGMEESDEWKD